MVPEMSSHRVLFVDADHAARQRYAAVAAAAGFAADTATADTAIAQLAAQPYTVVAVELAQPGPGDGRLIDELSASYPGTVFIAIARPDDLALVGARGELEI